MRIAYSFKQEAMKARAMKLKEMELKLQMKKLEQEEKREEVWDAHVAGSLSSIPRTFVKCSGARSVV